MVERSMLVAKSLTQVSIVFTVAIYCYGQRLPLGREQDVFSAEDEMVTKAVPLPAPIRRQLLQDLGVKDVMAAEGVNSDDFPKAWFTASEIHLSRRSTAEVIVMAVGPLAGANVTTFWIFRRVGGQFKLILVPPAPAHTLRVMGTFTNGFRDLQLLSATAVMVSSTVLKFNGTAYKQVATSLEPIR
jgi:hypothetical protein